MIELPGLWDREAEQAVIACAMLDPAVADECLPMLKPEVFYDERHRRTWEAIGALRSSRLECDLITLATELQKAGVMDPSGDGPLSLSYLQDVMLSTPAPSLGPQYAAQVLDVCTRRELMRAGYDTIAAAKDLDLPTEELRDRVETRLRSAADAAGAVKELRTLGQVMVEAGISVVKAYESEEGWTNAISTGMPWIDRRIGGGLHRGQLAILAARPSNGKSALSQAIGMDAAANGACVVFASAEMDDETVGKRALSRRSGIDSRKFTGYPPMGDKDWPVLSDAMGKGSEAYATLFVDSESRSVDEICAYTRRVHARQPVDLLIVDYLQYLRLPKGYRPSEIVTALGAMTKELRRLGRSLKCAVLCLSQLSRPEKGRENVPPDMTALRQSGEIEQDADSVFMLHRPPEENPPSVVQVQFIVRKQRNNERDVFMPIWFQPATGRWWDEVQWANRRAEKSD